MASFILSFGDLNRFVLRVEPTDDPCQEMINKHTYEDDHHWPWYLEDARSAKCSPARWSPPGLMLGGTDTKHFEPISDNICRFTPLRVGPADLARLHGSNERISVNGLGDAVRFYHRLLVQAAGDAQS